MKLFLLIAFSLIAACTTTQPEPTSTSTQALAPETSTPLPPTPSPWLHPSGRAHHQMVYDAECDQVFLFGGTIGGYMDPANASSEVWSYEHTSTTWKEMTPWSGPQPMSAVAAAYDAESNRVILFGGGITFRTITLDDAEHYALEETWAYDCNTDTWTEMAKGPPRRLGHQTVYHTDSDRIIVFGGFGVGGMNDTWAYDFNTDTWAEMKPGTSPPRRFYYSMAYDIESDRVLVWGGRDLPDKRMWAYDFNTDTWEKMGSTEGPLNRNFADMVYDSNADRVILYGGLGKDDTWAYDYNTNTWTEMKPDTNPGKLARHSMAYNPVLDKTILFGGRYYDSDPFIYMDETWVYDYNTNTWTNVTPNQ